MLVPDFESKLLIDITTKPVFGFLHPDDRKKYEEHIRARFEMVRLGVMRCPSWFQEELNRVDHRLRVWWDSWNEEWVIDRLQDEGIAERLRRMSEDGVIPISKGDATGLLENGAYYLTIIHFKPRPGFYLDRSLIETLKKCDMQRFESPKDYDAAKEAEADKIQKENDRLGTERLLGVVDKMSSKQIREFIETERAIQSGDTIVATGDDANILQKAQDEQRQALARGEKPVDDSHQAINPGMHPAVYQRERKELP